MEHSHNHVIFRDQSPIRSSRRPAPEFPDLLELTNSFQGVDRHGEGWLMTCEWLVNGWLVTGYSKDA